MNSTRTNPRLTISPLHMISLEVNRAIWMAKKAAIGCKLKDMHMIERIGLNPNITATEIARQLSVTQQTAYNTVNELIRRGFVVGCKVGREKQIKLSDTGLAVFNALEANLIEAREIVLRELIQEARRRA